MRKSRFTEEFQGSRSVSNQSAHLVDYARRQRAGKPVSTATTEGTANTLFNCRMNNGQQMRCSAAGADAVLAIRTEVVNGTFPPVSRMA